MKPKKKEDHTKVWMLQSYSEVWMQTVLLRSVDANSPTQKCGCKQSYSEVWMQTVLLRRGKEIILGDRGREEGERKGGRRDGREVQRVQNLKRGV